MHYILSHCTCVLSGTSANLQIFRLGLVDGLGLQLSQRRNQINEFAVTFFYYNFYNISYILITRIFSHLAELALKHPFSLALLSIRH